MLVPNVFNGLLQCTKEKSHVIKRYLGNKRQNAVLPLSDFLYRSNRHQLLDESAILAIFWNTNLRSKPVFAGRGSKQNKPEQNTVIISVLKKTKTNFRFLNGLFKHYKDVFQREMLYQSHSIRSFWFFFLNTGFLCLLGKFEGNCQ